MKNFTIRPFDIQKDTFEHLAETIYRTDPEFYTMMVGNDEKVAVKRILPFVREKKNSFSYENMHIAEENGKIIALLNAYVEKDIDRLKEYVIVLKSLNLWYLIRMLFFYPILRSTITMHIPDDTLYICNIYVDPQYRRKGIGSELIAKAKELARHKNKQKILLDVYQRNFTAIAFYKKQGLEIVKEKGLPFAGVFKTYSMEETI